MTKPKSEAERTTEFATAIYHALSRMKDEDYPKDVPYHKRGLGMLFHSQTTVEQMDKIFQNVVKRILKKHRLKLERKPRNAT